MTRINHHTHPSNTTTQLRRMAVFKPDDINDLYPFPRNRISYPGVERIKGYRYPAPGCVRCPWNDGLPGL